MTSPALSIGSAHRPGRELQDMHEPSVFTRIGFRGKRRGGFGPRPLARAKARLSSRRLAGVGLAVLTLLAVPTAAANPPSNYFGYDYLGPTTAPDCTSGPGARVGVSGFSCDGWNNWDYTQIDRTCVDGGTSIGFIANIPGSYPFNGPDIHACGETTVLWSDYVSTHYNRSACFYNDGQRAYAQCRALIF